MPSLLVERVRAFIEREIRAFGFARARDDTGSCHLDDLKPRYWSSQTSNCSIQHVCYEISNCIVTFRLIRDMLYLCSLPRKHLVSMQNQLVGCERNILSIGFRKLELCLFLFEFVGRFSASSFSEEPLRYPHHLRWSALCCVCVRGFKVQLSTAPLHTAGRNHAYKWQTSDIPSLPHSLMIYTYIHTQIHIISIIHQHTFTLGIYIYCLFSGCLHSPVCDPSTYILSLSSPQKQAKPVGG